MLFGTSVILDITLPCWWVLHYRQCYVNGALCVMSWHTCFWPLHAEECVLAYHAKLEQFSKGLVYNLAVKIKFCSNNMLINDHHVDGKRKLWTDGSCNLTDNLTIREASRLSIWNIKKMCQWQCSSWMLVRSSHNFDGGPVIIVLKGNGRDGVWS